LTTSDAVKKPKKKDHGLSLLDEFLEDDNHFQNGKFDKPIALKNNERRILEVKQLDDVAENPKGNQKEIKRESGNENPYLDAPNTKGNQKEINQKLLDKTPPTISGKSKGNQKEIKRESKGNQNHLKGIKRESERESERESKGNQKEIKRESKGDQIFLFNRLSFLQARIMIFLFYECQNSFERRTGELTNLKIASVVNSTGKTVKNEIKRLRDRCFLTTNFNKVGRNGWRCFDLPESVFASLSLLNTQGQLNTEKWSKRESERESERESNFPCSSSSKELNTTTEKQKAEKILKQEAQELILNNYPWERFSVLNFTRKHAAQILSAGHFDAGEVFQFASDCLDDWKNKRGNLRNPHQVLLANLSRGKPYHWLGTATVPTPRSTNTPPVDTSPEDFLMDDAFQVWLTVLPLEERARIVGNEPDFMHPVTLRLHFSNFVFTKDR